ncbi:MAG: potassium-transporting ATPase subunit F [Alphaproteobacteria bacterium]|nr:potassium-transporting ATPase subunit F [Alphaproteobacteria bacterium]
MLTVLDLILGGLLVIVVFVYMVITLLWPERF